MRTDQRAWISMSSGPGKAQKDANGNTSVTVPMSIVNTGKTPAKQIFSKVVVEKVRNGESPEFIYENRPHVNDSTGTIFPNAPPAQFDAVLLQGKPHKPGEPDTEPVLLTPFQFQDLVDGTSYLAIYGTTSYTDVFDIKHFVNFCSFASFSPTTIQVTARKCSDYNDVDNN
jgi:hypothetical protein